MQSPNYLEISILHIHERDCGWRIALLPWWLPEKALLGDGSTVFVGDSCLEGGREGERKGFNSSACWHWTDLYTSFYASSCAHNKKKENKGGGMKESGIERGWKEGRRMKREWKKGEREKGRREDGRRKGGRAGRREEEGSARERKGGNKCWNSIMEYQKLKYLGVGETWTTAQHMWLVSVQRGKWTNQITRPSVSGLQYESSKLVSRPNKVHCRHVWISMVTKVFGMTEERIANLFDNVPGIPPVQADKLGGVWLYVSTPQ